MLTSECIGVVVPAHDEQELVGGCVRALAVAAGAVAVPVHVVLVLDACTDSTAAAVQATTTELRAAGPLPFAGLTVLTVDAADVGAARRAGAEVLLAARSEPVTWLATTDADSRVPPRWLRGQLAHRVAGADAVVGTVTVTDWEGWPAPVTRLYLDRYHAADGHRHVHGANLGISVQAYRSVGGFADGVTDEDVALVDAVVAAGFRVTWAADQPVLTSARPVGRAPDGFAAYLCDLADPHRPGRRDTRRRARSTLDRAGTETVA